MPNRLQGKPPKLRHHKPTGRAYVAVGGRSVYLGKHGSAESWRRYHALAARLIESGGVLPDDLLPAGECSRPRVAGGAGPVLVKHVVLNFLRGASKRYRSDDGRSPRELENYRSVGRLLVNTYGDAPAADFGPRKLAELQGWMIRGGWTYRDPQRPGDADAPRKTAKAWCRNSANRQLGRVKYMFRKAVAAELVPPSVLAALEAAEGLRHGASDARETAPIRPVSESHAELAVAFMPPPVAAMVRLQLITGMRPHEVVEMRGRDLDTAGKAWAYTPERHKTQHRGQHRAVYLGPDAQAVVRPFLKADLSAPLFSPREAEAWRRGRQHAARATPINQGNRPGYGTSTREGTRRKRREPGDAYTVASYRRCIDYACAKAFPHPELERLGGESNADHESRIGNAGRAALLAWRKAQRFHPHQSRHTAATRIAKAFRLEVAQAVLGHKHRATTERYAALADDLAREAMERAG